MSLPMRCVVAPMLSRCARRAAKVARTRVVIREWHVVIATLWQRDGAAQAYGSGAHMSCRHFPDFTFIYHLSTFCCFADVYFSSRQKSGAARKGAPVVMRAFSERAMRRVTPPALFACRLYAASLDTLPLPPSLHSGVIFRRQLLPFRYYVIFRCLCRAMLLRRCCRRRFHYDAT